MTADPALLERTAELAVLTRELEALAESGRGRVVLVAGEAGIGKTALARAFTASPGPARVYWGSCDALLTPRPLGPLADIAEQAGGDLRHAFADAAGPADLFPVLTRDMRRRRATVLVIEDLHWADEATLDFVRLLGRRIDMVPALLLVTYRDDELSRTHPLRTVLGELPATNVRRLALAPLSPAGVASLARGSGIDSAALHRAAAGNPFYVTEVLAVGGTGVPASVRDAVLARAAQLDEPQRAVLDAVAVVPPRAELWLLEALVGDALSGLEACLTAGMLRTRGSAIEFRHELARVAIEQAMPPDQALVLHRTVLTMLTNGTVGAADLARVAHHAEAAADSGAIWRYAPAAGERAAALGAHREAAAQFARALRVADAQDPEERALLLERHSYECYLTQAVEEAIGSRQAALALHRVSGDRLREGESHRWLSRLAWFAGDNTTAGEEAALAVALLEPLPPGRELAMAYSNQAQLHMLGYDLEGARSWGSRASELAERLGETEVLVHSLNNIGTAELAAGLMEGVQKLERSLALASAAGLDEHVARAHTNLACSALDLRDYVLAEHHLEAGIAFCEERDLDSWARYMLGWRGRLRFERGSWDPAADDAVSVLGRSGTTSPGRITPLTVLGRLRARRGDPGAWEALDEADELARPTGELQRLLPVALARAEARWLEGAHERVGGETEATLQLALSHHRPWEAGELLLWRRRAGIADAVPTELDAEPLRLELAGEAERAADAWDELGCPYEAALALLASDQESALRRSAVELERLGARQAAAYAFRALRERGVRGLRTGPRAATRANPCGLTARELEVLQLVAVGLRNSDIAQRLVLSPKTVDHHVSAVLRKLDAGTRTEAVAAGVRLGVIER